MKIFSDYKITDMLIWESIKRLCTNNIYLSIIILIIGGMNMQIILNLNQILTAALIIITLVGAGKALLKSNYIATITSILVGSVMVALINAPSEFSALGKMLIAVLKSLGGGFSG
jgi:hypothetical protein